MNGRVLVRCSAPDEYLAGVVDGRPVWTLSRANALVVRHDRDVDRIAKQLDDPAFVLGDTVLKDLA